MACLHAIHRLGAIMIFISFCSVLIPVRSDNITDEHIIELVNSYCDYDGLCLLDESDSDILVTTLNSSEIFTRQPDTKCCQPCLCKINCVHENCCPGAVRHTTMRATCRSQNDVFNVHRGLQESEMTPYLRSDYFIVDTCPENARADLRHACLTPKAFEDKVFVSSLDNSVIFKNAKCAQCNQVFYYRTWKQILYNENSVLPKFIMNLNTSLEMWLAGTHVFSREPTDESNVMSVHRCTSKHTRLSFCHSKNADSILAKKCETVNGPMYTTNRIPYPNTFCYACRVSEQDPYAKCRFEEIDKTVKIYPLVLTLDYRETVKQKTPVHHHCEIGLVQNPITVSDQ